MVSGFELYPRWVPLCFKQLIVIFTLGDLHTEVIKRHVSFV